MGEEKEIVGMIRGCIKTVTCGKRLCRNSKNIINSNNAKASTTNNNAANASSLDSRIPTKQVPVYTKVGYILGLRVPSTHRYQHAHTKLLLLLLLFRFKYLKIVRTRMMMVFTKNDPHVWK